MFLFVVGQFLFSSLYQPLADSANFYPAYTWKIFHTQPDRFIHHNEIYFYKIDAQEFSPPLKGIPAVEEHFPHIVKYEFSRKVQLYTRGSESRASVIAHFNRLFTQKNQHVVWEISEKKFNPIEYYWQKKIINEDFLGKHEAVR